MMIAAGTARASGGDGCPLCGGGGGGIVVLDYVTGSLAGRTHCVGGHGWESGAAGLVYQIDQGTLPYRTVSDSGSSIILSNLDFFSQGRKEA